MREKQEIKSKRYFELVQLAIDSLKTGKFEEAKAHIYEGLALCDASFELQNLLGIYHELTGDRLLALRHYRAAYALEPAFDPATKNIERLTYGDFLKPSAYPFFGDEALFKVNMESQDALQTIVSR